MKAKFLFSFFLLATISSLLMSQNYDQFHLKFKMQGQHPVISEVLNALNKDSIEATIQFMVNMGTRFMYAENRREVATKIAEKFKSYGYTDVVLDSFKMVGESIPEDSVWQYNVIATVMGTSAPEEVYIISAHHDDFMIPDPHQLVPGADDNASGCAAALEIARVFKTKGFQPATTIRFVTYAAEELVGYTDYSGSIYHANKVAGIHEDVRMAICNDMIGYTKDSTNSIWGVDLQNGRYSWAGELTLATSAIYTSLNVLPGSYPVSDSYRFWELGYCVAGFEEFGMNPNYHTVNDSVSNCNMDFCREVIKANCAILMNEQLTPVPQDPYCVGGKTSVTLLWKSTANDNVKSYKIFRSESPDSLYSFLGQTDGKQFSYIDTTAIPGTLYSYYISSVDELQFESMPSNRVRGAAAPKNRELLVVKDSYGGYNNPPDSTVSAFYQKIFHDLPHDYCDASLLDTLNLAVLGKYQRIVWLSNAYSDQKNSSFRRNAEDINSYLRGNGQLFLSGFQPSFLIRDNIKVNISFNPEDTISQLYKIASVERKAQAALNGAWPCQEEYDSIRIDSSKCISQLSGHVMNVECISPTTDARIIYRFNTGYDTATIQGSMKGKPVGIEYLANDHKVIILSVPVFYLDSLDAKKLVELIVKEKFKAPVGFEDDENSGKNHDFFTSYPNPCHDRTMINYHLTVSSEIFLEVYSMTGKLVYRRSEGVKNAGDHTIALAVDQFNAGIYLMVLRKGKSIQIGRMIIF